MTPPGRALVGGLLIAIVMPELVLQAGDAGLIGSPRWRLIALSHGALWQGLLDGWTPNFALQPLTMFFSYGFLHVGFGHLAGNLIACLAFAPTTLRRTGARGLALVLGASLLAGAIGFVLLSDSPRPMIGASGAVYGLAAAWIFWHWRARRRRGVSLAPVWGQIALLVLSNLLGVWWLTDGLAWQAHLGGALAGWAVAARLARRRKGRDREQGSSQDR